MGRGASEVPGCSVSLFVMWLHGYSLNNGGRETRS